MKIEDVKRLLPIERFLYWIRERYELGLRKESGEPKPWTDDEILQRYFFTWPYREMDKTTVWFRENVREPLRDDPAVLMATVIFRWFNLISTGEYLLSHGCLRRWSSSKALIGLRRIRAKKQPVFTGAFMISSPPGKPKLEGICDRIDMVWKDRASIFRGLSDCNLRMAHRMLVQYKGLGGFMAYEVVTDLRHTVLLEGADDIMTWCNPGPGCIRGIYRVAGEEIKNKSNATSPPKPKDWLGRMNSLLDVVQKELSTLPPFEMRELEHSLCEFDKYSRALAGDGRLKRRYQGV